MEYRVRKLYQHLRHTDYTLHNRSELASLAPVTLSFYIGAPKEGERGTIWNSFLLFSGEH
jgi:hypothetical protein